jgi:SAM-dependent methyltransferase
MSIAHELESNWHNSTAGQYLLAKEQALYDQAVFDLFGFKAVQMGSSHMDLLRNSRIPNRYHAAGFPVSTSTDTPFETHLCCCDDFLPFADMSLDLLLLPHRLEFSERPHQTLREAARVMMPEGHLLISGFNPLSTWGATAGINKWLFKNQTYPWNGKFIGLTRLKDWLALLGFEVISVETCCHVPPFEQPSWHKRSAFMDKVGMRCCARLGGDYFIVAKKRVVGMTPIKPNWKTTPLKSALAVRQPKSNTVQSNSVQSNSVQSKPVQKTVKK